MSRVGKRTKDHLSSPTYGQLSASPLSPRREEGMGVMSRQIPALIYLRLDQCENLRGRVGVEWGWRSAFRGPWQRQRHLSLPPSLPSFLPPSLYYFLLREPYVAKNYLHS